MFIAGRDQLSHRESRADLGPSVPVLLFLKPVREHDYIHPQVAAFCVIVPCYNEEEMLPAFFKAVVPALEKATEGHWSIVCVDDGSRDATFAQIAAEHARDERVQESTSAGISATRLPVGGVGVWARSLHRDHGLRSAGPGGSAGRAL